MPRPRPACALGGVRRGSWRPGRGARSRAHWAFRRSWPSAPSETRHPWALRPASVGRDDGSHRLLDRCRRQRRHMGGGGHTVGTRDRRLPLRTQTRVSSSRPYTDPPPPHGLSLVSLPSRYSHADPKIACFRLSRNDFKIPVYDLKRNTQLPYPERSGRVRPRACRFVADEMTHVKNPGSPVPLSS